MNPAEKLSYYPIDDSIFPPLVSTSQSNQDNYSDNGIGGHHTGVVPIVPAGTAVQIMLPTDGLDTLVIPDSSDVIVQIDEAKFGEWRTRGIKAMNMIMIAPRASYVAAFCSNNDTRDDNDNDGLNLLYWEGFVN